MPFASRGRHSIHYELLGNEAAPPLLLIMGLALSGRGWGKLADVLSRRFRVVVFDNRGTGRSGKARLGLRMRDLADDAAAVLDAAGIGKADVFGISMGGMIAQELALRHPERVRRLALGATFASYWRSRKPTLGVVLAGLAASLGAASNAAARISRLLLSEKFYAADPGRARNLLVEGELAGLRCAFVQMGAIIRHATQRKLGGIRSPTLVLTGDADRLVPHRNSERLAASIPVAKLVVFPGAGHAFPFEREEETADALIRHFQPDSP
ncbi:MAG: alpha/beta fold hydrolase [Deltaproteobacteria bacterium]|nr:MAG: alpha/beta fold hydrolase [Deltaproteobacteria bacterium]